MKLSKHLSLLFCLQENNNSKGEKLGKKKEKGKCQYLQGRARIHSLWELKLNPYKLIGIKRTKEPICYSVAV